jgi:FMN phosphatase YigB (HAD superfamily)
MFTFGVSKAGGLFGKVLEKFCIRAQDMVCVGDSWERHIMSARKEGILTVHCDENASVCLDLDGMKVNTLLKLEHIIK